MPVRPSNIITSPAAAISTPATISVLPKVVMARKSLDQIPKTQRKRKDKGPELTEPLREAVADSLCPRHAGWLFLFGGRRGGFSVLAAEALDASGGVHEFLLAGEKRVAIRADFHVDIAFVRGPGAECIAARAEHANFVVRGMNSCLHGISSFYA